MAIEFLQVPNKTKTLTAVLSVISLYEYQQTTRLTGTVVVVRKYYFAGSTRLAMNNNGTLLYLLSDHLGSSSVTYDPLTQQAIYQKYMPYGEIRSGNGSNALPTGYTYTGQFSHADDFGLMYYNARWYDPVLIQFNQPDSMTPQITNPGDWHRYAYGRFNSVKYSDPTGHCNVIMMEEGLCTAEDVYEAIPPECNADNLRCRAREQFEDETLFLGFMTLYYYSASGEKYAAYILEKEIPVVWSTNPHIGSANRSCVEGQNYCWMEPGSPIRIPSIYKSAAENKVEKIASSLAHETFHYMLPYGNVEDTLYEEYYAYRVGSNVYAELTGDLVLGFVDPRNADNLVSWFEANGLSNNYSDLKLYPPMIFPLNVR